MNAPLKCYRVSFRCTAYQSIFLEAASEGAAIHAAKTIAHRTGLQDPQLETWYVNLFDGAYAEELPPE
jgi:hypothetical protein